MDRARSVSGDRRFTAVIGPQPRSGSAHLQCLRRAPSARFVEIVKQVRQTEAGHQYPSAAPSRAEIPGDVPQKCPQAQSRNQPKQAASKIDLKRPLIEACRNYPLFDGRQPFAVHQFFLSIIESRTAQHCNGTKEKKAGGIPVQFRILPLRDAFLRLTQTIIRPEERRALPVENGTSGCQCCVFMKRGPSSSLTLPHWSSRGMLKEDMRNARPAWEFRWLVVTIVLAAAVPGLLRSSGTQTFSVKVHDVMGSPVRGAEARLLSIERVYVIKAKADGELRFNDVVPGVYELEVSANGFRPRNHSDLRIPSGDSLAIEVTLDHAPIPDHCGYVNTVDYEALGGKTRILSGHVIYEDTGKSLTGVKIELLDTSSNTENGATVSDRNGDFAFRDLPAGRYSVRASKSGYESTEITRFLVPRENPTVLRLGLDKRGHMDVCQ